MRITLAGLAFAAAVRMVVRVHRDAAVLRADAEPAVAACLTERDVLMLEVADLTDRCAAIHMHLAELAGRQTHVMLFAAAKDGQEESLRAGLRELCSRQAEPAFSRAKISAA